MFDPQSITSDAAVSLAKEVSKDGVAFLNKLEKEERELSKYIQLDGST